MGAWGAGAFDNDIAMDWIGDSADLGKDGVTATIEAALWPPVAGLESDGTEEGCAVLAACETIAVAFGRPGSGVTDALRSDLAPLLDGLAEMKGLPDLALRGLAHVTADGSELSELWGEDPEAGADWLAAVDDLRERLVDLHRSEPTAWERDASAPIAQFVPFALDAEDEDLSGSGAGGPELLALLERAVARIEMLEQRVTQLEKGRT